MHRLGLAHCFLGFFAADPGWMQCRTMQNPFQKISRDSKIICAAIWWRFIKGCSRQRWAYREMPSWERVPWILTKGSWVPTWVQCTSEYVWLGLLRSSPWLSSSCISMAVFVWTEGIHFFMLLNDMDQRITWESQSIHLGNPNKSKNPISEFSEYHNTLLDGNHQIPYYVPSDNDWQSYGKWPWR